MHVDFEIVVELSKGFYCESKYIKKNLACGRKAEITHTPCSLSY